MNTSYKKILNKSKLILSDFNTDNFSQNYLIKILTKNNISGLISTELNMVNSMPILSYDITSKHSVASVLENKKADYSLFSSIMQGLHRLCYTLDDFMLDSGYLLLSPEYIFLDVSMQQPYFCYCPVCENNSEYSFTLQLKTFLEYVISKLNYNDTNCVAHVYSLHQKCIDDTLCIDDLTCISNETASDIPIDNFQDIPSDISSDNINVSPVNTSYSNNTQLTSSDDIFINNSPLSHICGFPAVNFFILVILGVLSAFTVVFGLYMYFIKKAFSPSMTVFICISGPVILLLYIPSVLRKRVGKKIPLSYTPEDNCSATPFTDDFSKDLSTSDLQKFSTHIMPIGETVLISSNHSPAVPHLLYNGNDFSEDIELTAFPFTLGKLPDSVNYIMENALISRIHARFYLKEDCYYIEDLNSSNGTYVNNIPLSPHTMTEIHDGDYITLACLTYIFKLC